VDRKLRLLFLFGLMISACLPMTPVMAAGVEALNGGYVADLENAGVPVNRTAQFEVTADSSRWDLARIEAPEAWEISRGGSNVTVAVLDTGIDAEHRDLMGKVSAATNFTNDSAPDILHGHGTHIAGLIAATAEDGGIAGLSPDCRLLDVKVAGNNGTTDARKLAEGIIWAVDHGAQVLNISIVINKPYPLLEYAADYAWRKGCLIVAAAGNGFSSEPVYPAAYPHVIAVGATDRGDIPARWSNRGEWVSVFAPGVDIVSTLPGNRSGAKSGTSYATALVSGEAALLFAETTDANADGQVNNEVSDIILDRCDELENGSIQRINVFKAASALLATQPQTD
jgi:thermitase